MARPTPPPGNAPLARVQLETARTRWQILWRGNTIELPRQGVLIIGRSPRCDVVIDSTQVSRTHCRIECTASGIVVEDLRSSNGLYVNGDRIRGTRMLASGDRLLLGTEELVIQGGTGVVETRASAEPPLMAPIEIVTDGPSEWRKQPKPEEPPPTEHVITTQKADAFETLGRLADRMLASGRHDAAAKILSGHMRSVLTGVRDGRQPPPEVLAGSTRYAMKLAAACQEASWLNYVIELHLALKLPVNVDVLAQLQGLVQRGLKIDRELLSNYKRVLRTAILDGAPHDRALVDSILALDTSG
jgi:hypothetical protein